MISKVADQGTAISYVVDIASADVCQVEVRQVVRIWGMETAIRFNKVEPKEPAIAVKTIL
jgi:hypothetical protein